MKKILSLVLTLFMMLAMLTGFSSVIRAASYPLGDTNGDNKVNAKDSLTLKLALAGKLNVFDSSLADVNGDGKVNALDVRMMKLYFGGAIDAFTAFNSGYKVQKITIAGCDINNYTLVIPDTYTEEWIYKTVNYAAKALRDLLEDACGYRPEIIYESEVTDGMKMIKFVQSLNGECTEQGYKITVDDGTMTIMAGKRAGWANGVYSFAEEFIGYRFVDTNVTFLYEAGLVNIPNSLDFSYDPPITYRDPHFRSLLTHDEHIVHCQELKVNSHSDRGPMESAKYGWGEGNCWFNAHSFYYLDGSNNNDIQPCLSSEAVYNTIYNNVKDVIDERITWGQSVDYELSRFSVSWNDNSNFCQCATCRSVYVEEGSVAGSILRFDNRMVVDFNKIWPNFQIYFIAYSDARQAPKITRPHDNLVICYCWAGCNNHYIADTTACKSPHTLGYNNNNDRADFEEWAAMTNHLFAWYYTTNFHFTLAPAPNVYNIYYDFKYFAEMGCEGIYAEGDAVVSFEPLKVYLCARMMWDPYITEDEFYDYIDEYLYIMYGDGAPYLSEYLDMHMEAGNTSWCWINNYGWPHDMYDANYMTDHYDEMCVLFDKAMAATDDATQLARIEQLSAHMHFMGISSSYATRGRSECSDDSVIRARYLKLYNIINNYDIDIGYVGGASGATQIDYDESPMVDWIDMYLYSNHANIHR